MDIVKKVIFIAEVETLMIFLRVQCNAETLTYQLSMCCVNHFTVIP